MFKVYSLHKGSRAREVAVPIEIKKIWTYDVHTYFFGQRTLVPLLLIGLIFFRLFFLGPPPCYPG
jgi:hypothetical protein